MLTKLHATWTALTGARRPALAVVFLGEQGEPVSDATVASCREVAIRLAPYIVRALKGEAASADSR
jgi:hypothetical protein